MRPFRLALLARACCLTLSLLGLGCEARVSLGGSCVYDSECGSLACLYGRCRAECIADVDCSGGGLVCNSGVCARPEESCSMSDPCESPELACAGSICATRCSVADTCVGDSTCELRVGGLVCVPRLDADAGPVDAGSGGPGDGGLGDGGRGDGGSTPIGVRDLCVGRYGACVARADGTVACWGVGTNGELGGGVPLAAGAPGVTPCAPFGVSGNLCSTELVTVVDLAGAPITDVVSLACGERTTLALTSGGHLYSWGLGSDGLLGRVFPRDNSVHARADQVTDRTGVPLEGVLRMTMGLRHGCAVLSDDTVRCWGAGDLRYQYGQLGTGLADPPPGDGAVEATALAGSQLVVAADTNTCAVDRTGAVVCVGSNEHACAGASSAPVTVPVRMPSPVSGVGTPSALIAGPAFFCALVGDAVSCWGQAVEGSLGREGFAMLGPQCPDGGDNLYCDPAAAPVTGALTFTAIAGGAQSGTVCALNEGRVYCWGPSDQGSAGSPSRVTSPSQPILRADDGTPLADVRLIRVGGSSSCALTSSDELYCWGTNQASHFRTAPETLVHDQAARVLLD